MKLIPLIETKKLNECVLGDLALYRDSGSYSKGIVAALPQKGDQAHALLRLDGTSSLTWIEIQNGQLVLCFGRGYCFVPDITCIVAASAQEWEKKGAMLIGEHDALIRVFPVHPGGAKLYYDIASGVAEMDLEKPDTQLAILSWSIRLSGQKEDESPFFSFTVS